MQCKQSLTLDETSELLYCDEGIYFFCSKVCSEKWMSVNTSHVDPESEQQATS
jgi:YHS domain-containing protein